MPGPYTINSNAKYDAILTRVVQRENGILAAQTPPGTPWTEASYLQAACKRVLDSYVADFQKTDTDTIEAALADPSLTAAKIAAVKVALGLP